jgi:hypothetical protein
MPIYVILYVKQIYMTYMYVKHIYMTYVYRSAFPWLHYKERSEVEEELLQAKRNLVFKSTLFSDFAWSFTRALPPRIGLHTHTHTHAHTHTHTHTHRSGSGTVQILKNAVDHTPYIHQARRLRICVRLLGFGVSLIFFLGLRGFVDFSPRFSSFMSGSWAAGLRRDDGATLARCVSEHHHKSLCCLL